MIFSSLFCLSKILYYKTHMLSDISSPLMSIQHYQVCKSVASTLLDDSKFYNAYILNLQQKKSKSKIETDGITPNLCI